jgi:ribosome-binding factor A
MQMKRKATISFIYDASVESLRGDKIIFNDPEEWTDHILDTTVAVLKEALKDNSIFGIIKITDIEVD